MQFHRINSKFDKLVMDFNLLVAQATPLGSKVQQLDKLPPRATTHLKPPSRKKTNVRQKRGLINLGGEWLKFIVGTATEKDVNILKKNLIKSNSLIKSELTFVAEEMKQLANSTNKVVREMERAEAHMDRISEKFESLYQSNILEELLKFYVTHLVELNNM